MADQVLAALDDWGVRATFFLIGQNLATPDGLALATQAHRAGQALGDHTMSHGPPLGEVADAAVQVAQVDEAQRALGDLSDPRKLFRPNGRGHVGTHLLGPAARQHLIDERFTVALWNVVVGDGQRPDGWGQRVWEAMPEQAWPVVVLHDYHQGMQQLPDFLERCLDAGIEFVQDFPSDCVPLDRGVPTDWLDEVTAS